MKRVIGTWQSSIAAQKQRYIEEFPQSVEEEDMGIICQEFINVSRVPVDGLGNRNLTFSLVRNRVAGIYEHCD